MQSYQDTEWPFNLITSYISITLLVSVECFRLPSREDEQLPVNHGIHSSFPFVNFFFIAKQFLNAVWLNDIHANTNFQLVL